jgi:hypothetical protein
MSPSAAPLSVTRFGVGSRKILRFSPVSKALRTSRLFIGPYGYQNSKGRVATGGFLFLCASDVAPLSFFVNEPNLSTFRSLRQNYRAKRIH